MTPLDKLTQTSRRARMGLCLIVVMILVISLYGYISEGVLWLTIGDGQFERLWSDYPDKKPILALIITPLLIALLLGVYRLQYLLKLFGQGQFFSVKSTDNLKWLAWLAVFGVTYNMFWPLLASPILNPQDSLSVNINPIVLIALLCIPLFVHLISAAGELQRENSEFI